MSRWKAVIGLIGVWLLSAAGLPDDEFDSQVAYSVPSTILSLAHGEGGTYTVSGDQHVVFPLRGGYIVTYQVELERGSPVNVYFVNESSYANYKHGYRSAMIPGDYQVSDSVTKTQPLPPGAWYMVVDALRHPPSNVSVDGHEATFQKLVAHDSKEQEAGPSSTFSVELRQDHPSYQPDQTSRISGANKSPDMRARAHAHDHNPSPRAHTPARRCRACHQHMHANRKMLKTDQVVTNDSRYPAGDRRIAYALRWLPSSARMGASHSETAPRPVRSGHRSRFRTVLSLT
jgi:hypothetical protein